MQKEKSAVMREFADIHSHVLFGVDDGCVDEGASLALLKKMQDAGLKQLVLTPHYCKRRGYETPIEKIKEHYTSLCNLAKLKKIDITLYLGTEMEYSNDCTRYIREGRVLTLGGSRYLLLEFAPYVSLDTIKRGCAEIMQLGLVPVVAHIERYECMYDAEGAILELLGKGVKIQVNILSVALAKGKTKKFLKHIFSNQLVHFLAGDVHSIPIDEKHREKCEKFVLRYSSQEYLEELTYKNANIILTGGEL